MLEIRLLGAFELKNGEKPIHLPSRAAQSLFAYLVLNRGTPHRREKLAGMFWPDAPEGRARASLRYELWRIRRALASVDQQEALLADDITVAFAPSSGYWLDVACFEEAADNAPADQLRKALVVYRGELLPGFYEDWVVMEREHLQRIFGQRVARLLILLEEEGRWDEIVEWAERWLSLDQDPEAAYRSLLIAYAGMGDRAKLLATYERYVAALHALELEPSDEIRSLLDAWRPASNLPFPLTNLIGREVELSEVSSLLEHNRLVTLTGTGGVGKTRLAIEVARAMADRFPDGVCYLELAPIRDPAAVPERLRSQLRLRGAVNESRSVMDLLCAYYRPRHTLLVLDNCEHLIEACAQLVNSLRSAAPALHILATSRESLRVAGESAYPVPCLELPSPEDMSNPAALGEIDSVRLFMERVRSRSREFAWTASNARLVGEICVRLDGIPLALELAAARVHMLPLESLVERLNDRFALLSGGLRTDIPRHQTLRAMIDWSYDLLSESEKSLLQRISVFRGGCSVEAAEAVCSGNGMDGADVLDLLARLVDKSLVSLDEKGRYRILETVRQYGNERLAESEDAVWARDRHLRYFLEMAEQAEPQLRGPDQLAWLARLDADMDNLRAALAWALDRDREACLRLVVALPRYWQLRSYTVEAKAWLEKILALTEGMRTVSRARALAALCSCYASLDDANKLWSLGQQAYTLAADLGDVRAMALAQLELSDPGLYKERQAGAEAADYAVQLARQSGDRWLVAQALLMAGYAAKDRNEMPLAKSFFEKALAESTACGDQALIGSALFHLATLHSVVGDWASMVRFLEQAAAVAARVGDLDVVTGCWLGRAVVALHEKRFAQAKDLAQRAYELASPHSMLVTMILARLYGALADWGLGDPDAFVASAQATVAEAQRSESGLLTIALCRLGDAWLQKGDRNAAREAYAQALDVTRQSPVCPGYTHSLQAVAGLAFRDGRLELAARLFGARAKRPESLPGQDFLPLLVDEREKQIAEARARLGEEAFAGAWAAGQTLSEEEALALAAQTLGEDTSTSSA